MNQYSSEGWNGQSGGPNNNPPTSEFGPVQQNPQGYGPLPPRPGMSTPVVVVITLLVALLVGLLVAAAFFVTPRLMGSSEGAATSTVSVTATAPAESAGEPGGESAPTVQPAQPVQPARPAPAGRPAGAYECWTSGSAGYNSVAVGSSVTSCEFAESVWGEYIGSGGNGGSMTVRAYSPVTGSGYTMSCSGGAVVTCTGGNNAVVYIY
ncbi:hypothetical protein ACWIE7_11155 [Dietzia sp. NPDC055343]